MFKYKKTLYKNAILIFLFTFLDFSDFWHKAAEGLVMAGIFVLMWAWFSALSKNK